MGPEKLKEKYGVVEASNKLTKMTVWCHSHHNMAPNPSGQDNRQFLELVKQQKDAGTNRPVLMLIFNKKDQYYSRIWDPQTNLTYEGLDIVYTQYDMSWIDKEAKLKFKEPVVKAVNYTSSSPYAGKQTYLWGSSTPSYNTKPSTFVSSYNYTGTPTATANSIAATIDGSKSTLVPMSRICLAITELLAPGIDSSPAPYISSKIT